MDVAQANIVERLQLLANPRLVLEELQRVRNGQVEHIGNRLAAEVHLEGLTIVPLALADLAGDEHVGQEVHLDLHKTVALTGFAPSALHVEGESPRSVAADLRFWKFGEQLTN